MIIASHVFPLDAILIPSLTSLIAYYSDAIRVLMGLKSPAIRLFVQQRVQTKHRENPKALHLLLWGDSTETGRFPSQRSSIVQSVFISWRHMTAAVRRSWNKQYDEQIDSRIVTAESFGANTSYRQTYCISCTKSQSLNVSPSRLAVVFAHSIEAKW